VKTAKVFSLESFAIYGISKNNYACISVKKDISTFVQFKNSFIRFCNQMAISVCSSTCKQWKTKTVNQQRIYFSLSTSFEKRKEKSKQI